MINLSKLTGEVVGKPFEEISCIGLLRRMYPDVEQPETWEDLTDENYLEKFKQAPKTVQLQLLKLMRTIGEAVSLREIKQRDLLVLLNKKGAVFPAVYLGKGMVLTSTIKDGVLQEPVKAYTVLMARRVV